MSEHERNRVEDDESDWIAERQRLGSSERESPFHSTLGQQQPDDAPHDEHPDRRQSFDSVEGRDDGTTMPVDLGADDTHGRASFDDPIPRYVDPAHTSTGQDAAGGRSTPAAETPADPWMKQPNDQGGVARTARDDP